MLRNEPVFFDAAPFPDCGSLLFSRFAGDPQPEVSGCAEFAKGLKT